MLLFSRLKELSFDVFGDEDHAEQMYSSISGYFLKDSVFSNGNQKNVNSFDKENEVLPNSQETFW